MKILHIDETFHPNFGYQCTPLAKFQQKAGHEVYIIAPEAKYIYPVYHSFGEYGENLDADDAVYSNATGVKIYRVAGKGRIAGRLIYNGRDLFKTIEQINPDVMLVHCVETLTAIRVMRKYKNRYPMVFDSHMLSMASKNKFVKIYEKFYKMIVARLIKKRKYNVIKTQNDDYVTSHLGIPQEQAPFISFGTDTLLFCPDEAVRKKFIEENDLSPNAFIITSTGKLTESKGGKLFAEAVKEKFNSDREVAVVVVANFDGEYEKEVREILDKSENKIFYFPVQKYLELAKFYQIADVTVFPKQCSMSFYDAQGCGSPVVSEDNSVNLARNSHGNGYCFKSGSVEDLRHQLEKIMNLSPLDYKAVQSAAIEFIHANYDYSDIAGEYTEVLKDSYTQFWRQ